jgi:23S rRNA G2445 N2-methylase RlmL
MAGTALVAQAHKSDVASTLSQIYAPLLRYRLLARQNMLFGGVSYWHRQALSQGLSGIAMHDHVNAEAVCMLWNTDSDRVLRHIRLCRRLVKIQLSLS